jgi:zinc and cadmium transporter
MAWPATTAHEIPQELGDLGVLVHGGWEKRKTLMFNVLSAPTFLVGGLLTYLVSFNIDVSFLTPFAAENSSQTAGADTRDFYKVALMAHSALARTTKTSQDAPCIIPFAVDPSRAAMPW